MKKRLLGLLVFSPLLALSISHYAQAVNPVGGFCDNGGGGTLACQEGQQNSEGDITGNNGIVVTVAEVLVYAAGILSVIMLIIGGIKYATSNGDSGNLKSAKNTVLYALIGLVIAIFAQAIVQLVITRIFE